MTEVTHITTSAMTRVMMLAGTDMVVVNALAWKLADKYCVSRVTGSLAALWLGNKIA